MRIHLRPEAERDMDLQALYYLQHAGLAIASRFYDAVQETANLIASQPEIGQRFSTADSRHAGVRFRRVSGFGEHLMFYQAGSDVIEIVRVLHGKQDIDAVLG
jgi:toxin ParE1/3/4